MYANYHTHTFRCGHASGTEEEYIQRAIAGGIKILGFSDHAPFAFPDGYQSGFRVQTQDAEDYISTLRALREKYKDKITIHIGFEMEYYPLYFKDMLAYVKALGAEYLILGQHFIGNEYPNGEHSLSCDGDADKFREYTNCVIEGMKSGKYLYVAHPDMFIYRRDDEVYRTETERLCRAAKELDVPLEINFFGIFGSRHYPDIRLWKTASRIGNKVIFGFDAHSAERAFDESSLKKAQQLVKELNLNLVDELEIKGL